MVDELMLEDNAPPSRLVGPVDVLVSCHDSTFRLTLTDTLLAKPLRESCVIPALKAYGKKKKASLSFAHITIRHGTVMHNVPNRNVP